MNLNILFSILFISLNCFASETIQTGRPGQSIGAGVVGEAIFQIQSGIDSTQIEDEDRVLNSNNIARYGIDTQYELSALFDSTDLGGEANSTGNFQVGGRVSLIEKASGYTPQLAFQTRFQLVDSEGEQNENLRFVSILSAVFDLETRGSLTSNLRGANLNDESFDIDAYTLSWSQNYTRELSYFFEIYSIKSDEQWISFWDTGVGYLIHDDLAVDFSFGTDLESDFDSNFVAAGFSWRKI